MFPSVSVAKQTFILTLTLPSFVLIQKNMMVIEI